MRDADNKDFSNLEIFIANEMKTALTKANQ